MLSFATSHYEWEWKYSEGDVQDRFSRNYIQLVTIGEQAGTWGVPLMDQLSLVNDPWTQRTFAAVRLVHELDGYGGAATTDKLLKPVFAMLDKPTTIAYRYWDDRPMPANCANADIPLRGLQRSRQGRADHRHQLRFRRRTSPVGRRLENAGHCIFPRRHRCRNGGTCDDREWPDCPAH